MAWSTTFAARTARPARTCVTSSYRRWSATALFARNASFKSWTASKACTKGARASVEYRDWTWENNALFFATDPVAMDHIAWGYIDAKRKEKGLAPSPPSAKMGIDADREGFDMRQPQHIRLAARLGLGVFDLKPAKRRALVESPSDCCAVSRFRD